MPEDATEAAIRARLAAGDLEGGATAALRRYGPEILGWLIGSLRDGDAADEVFAQFCEDFWRGIARFAGQSSCRTWMYVIARHACARYLRAPYRVRHRRAITGELERVAAEVRTETRPWLRSEVKDQVAALRDALSTEDRSLLILRVDRSLGWRDIARVLGEPDLDERGVERESARLRKRFQLLKADLRRRARALGLDSGAGGA